MPSPQLNDDRLPPRFWAKICANEKTGCWEWTACKSERGYALFGAQNTNYRAHRLSYERLVGPPPSGLQIDHLCRVRHCVNPAHLEPVTQQENIRRGNAGKPQKARTHCPRGHEYTPENTIQARTGRVCRACARNSVKAAYYKKRAST